MKALVVSDIHKSASALATTTVYIKEHEPDLLLILGDFTTFQPLAFASEYLLGLPDIQTLAVPGNCDPREILNVLDDSSAFNLHAGKTVIDGIMFVGLGGSNTTPFNTPFELTEEEIFEALDPILEPCVVLVLHCPVKGHLDLVPGGDHTGSTALAELVRKYKPILVLSGHIHETRGIDQDENGILYVNPGALRDGYASILEITHRPGPDQRQVHGTQKQIKVNAFASHNGKFEITIQMLSNE